MAQTQEAQNVAAAQAASAAQQAAQQAADAAAAAAAQAQHDSKHTFTPGSQNIDAAFKQGQQLKPR
jgi:hypothetical protein